MNDPGNKATGNPFSARMSNRCVRSLPERLLERRELLGLELNAALREPAHAFTPGLMSQFHNANVRLANENQDHLLCLAGAGKCCQCRFAVGHRWIPIVVVRKIEP